MLRLDRPWPGSGFVGGTDLYVLKILISDDGEPPLSSTTRAIITIEDINDHSPEFEQQMLTVHVPSSISQDDPLLKVKTSNDPTPGTHAYCHDNQTTLFFSHVNISHSMFICFLYIPLISPPPVKHERNQTKQNNKQKT